MNQKNNQLPPVAMAGFFGWLKRTVNNILNAVSEVSHNPFFIITIIDDAFDGDGEFNLGNSNPGEYLFRNGAQQEINLTIQEQTVLDLWVETQFKPLFLNYFSELKEFSVNSPRLSVFKQFYNNLHEFIAYLKWSVSRDVSSGLDPVFSINALLARNQFLDIQISVLLADLNEYIDATGISFSSEKRPINVNTSKYQVLGFRNVPPTLNTEARQVVEDSFVENSTDTALNNDDVVVYTPPKNNKNKSSVGALLVFGLLGAALVYSLSKSDDGEVLEK